MVDGRGARLWKGLNAQSLERRNAVGHPGNEGGHACGGATTNPHPRFIARRPQPRARWGQRSPKQPSPPRRSESS